VVDFTLPARRLLRAIGLIVAFYSGMYPTQIQCNHCGQSAPVINCVPIYADPDHTGKVDTAQRTLEVSCKVDCPQCGNRIQVVKLAGS
jgi:hypothetical protein